MQSQLGERNTGSVEVSGSIPLSSTISNNVIENKKAASLGSVAAFLF